ncbi:MAG TPA: DPP IV N-terminal domain-containing protein, partial [Luteitalea sp.]|nr:DPP IV N-terminal domain-containing protein [Luteitalea sp.]
SDGTATLHRDPAALADIAPTGLVNNPVASRTADDSRRVYVVSGDLWFVDVAGRSARRLTQTPGVEQTPTLSPDGRQVAFTRAGNLYTVDVASGLERQLTVDGSDTILNGYASWVYFEEILGRASAYRAFWWSPDSARLAFLRFDDGPVPVFPIYWADGQHGKLEQQRYPKAGDPNPFVRVGAVAATGGNVTWMQFPPQADHYLAWLSWTADSQKVFIQWMNREQDTIRVLHGDPRSGAVTPLFEEKQSSWVSWFEDLTPLANGDLLVRSDVDGWDHLYLHGADGTRKRQLTSGEWRVRDILHVDEAAGTVLVLAQPGAIGSTWNNEVRRVRLDGSGTDVISKTPGTYQVRVSPDGTQFLATRSSATEPASLSLFRADGTLVRDVASARGTAAATYAWGRTELFTIPSGDGFDLPALWVLPPDFDKKKTYPVMINVYGGPDAGTVRNTWASTAAHYWAQRGVIWMALDHRGSGHHGKKGTALMHRVLGKWEMHDYGKAAEWLRTQPFVAKDRIAITGGSYGGYTTLMALTNAAPAFNLGLSNAPVSDWRLYDSVYTERYMDRPAENPEGYKAGAVLTWADRYVGGLRLTHGTIDDNVHMQNSMQVVDWLTEHDKPFELMVYPDSRHGVQASQRKHSARGAHDFWVRTLLHGKLPAPPATAAPTRQAPASTTNPGAAPDAR